jgi:hypothetical protein
MAIRDGIRAVAGISLAVAITAGVAVYERSIAAQPLVPTCVTDEDRVHIRAQVLTAVDEAFRDNMKHLFTIWLKDARDQPHRASAGLQNSIVVYQRARADALKWSPASC